MQRHHLPTVALTLGATLSCAGVTRAQEWTRFRGPGGSGHGVAELPAKLDAEHYNWRVELPGKGHSSPVLWGDEVFVTCLADERVVVALAAKDGAERWRFASSFEPHPQHDLNSFASATPAVDDERVYVVWTSGDDLVAVALEHRGERPGKLAWEKKLGPFRARHGSGVSPVLAGGTLVVACDNEGDESFLVGLDPATGETRWKRRRESVRASYATPLVFEKEGADRVAFASTAHGLTCLDPATGELVWEVDDLFAERCVASPIVAGSVLFTTTGKGGGGVESVALDLADRDEAGVPQVLFRARRALPYVPTAIAVGEYLFLWNDGGIVSCLDLAKGEEVWRERIDGRFFGSPVCVGDRMYAMSMAGELFVVRAAAEFELLGRFELGEPSQATPALASGTMYLRTETHLISVGGK
ncbi:MAG: PQQ-binding-like beta-propeller repeat protein [bacterium]|nr:PQQ-binding-like beta-propeller repeat protein [bacterium]